MAVAVPYYNLFLGLGVGAAAVLFERRTLQYFPRRAERERALILLLVVMPCAAVGTMGFDRITGAAIGPLLPVRGLAFYGGLVAAMITTAVVAPLLRVNIRRVLDAGAPSIALGLAIGRVGCGLAGCCFGVHSGAHGLWHHLGFDRVPTQWLESGAVGLLAWALARYEPRREGDVIAAFFAGYAVIRFAIETVRDDPRGAIPVLPSFLSPSQWISLAFLGVAAALVATRSKHAPREVTA